MSTDVEDAGHFEEWWNAFPEPAKMRLWKSEGRDIYDSARAPLVEAVRGLCTEIKELAGADGRADSGSELLARLDALMLERGIEK